MNFTMVIYPISKEFAYIRNHAIMRMRRAKGLSQAHKNLVVNR